MPGTVKVAISARFNQCNSSVAWLKTALITWAEHSRLPARVIKDHSAGHSLKEAPLFARDQNRSDIFFLTGL